MPISIEIPTRKHVIQGWKDRGGGVAAVFPVHYPRALLRAFGLLPVEVWGPPGRETSSGDAHLQAYTCSIVRCGLSFVLDGGLDGVDAIVVPHACDSLQGLGSLLLDFVAPSRPVLPLYLPRGRRESDAEFLAAELRSLHDKLAGVTGKRPAGDELSACVVREEEADAALADLLAARPRLPMSNRDFYGLVRSREYLPAEDFEVLARRALEQVGHEPEGGARIVLSGLVPEPVAVLDTLDAASVMVAADDLACAGRRLYPPGQASEPFARMVESLQAGPPDSTRGSPVQDRLAHLLDLTRRSRARGVVYLDVKFCEPEQFYIPQLDRGLKSAGLRTLAVEVDIADPLPGQVVTVLQAFAETIS